MLSDTIGLYGQRARDSLARFIARIVPNPNHLTLVGLCINVLAAFLFGFGWFMTAGFVLILAGAFDILDGAVARLTSRTTKFGAFFDSVMDRYSDLAIFIGIMVFYARDTPRHSTLYVALTGIALIGSVMISYTRARAESLIPKCKVGFLERPERLVLLIIGSMTEVPWLESNYFLHKMPAVIWLLAVLSHWTVVHRMYHTWKEVLPQEEEFRPLPENGPVRDEPADPSFQTPAPFYVFSGRRK
ncbi:MAG: CDP-alcohol phosphatidyltransferase family protein [Acidobacteria bacterium]|nr:CDP-alcohol phosphatidyltransferase family protein [Acidobacteriota bacterium]